ncbi:hypothetical protein FEM48_Zijuj06G0056900 [Ziziphus jujuba var. spinosa]|uniref:Uncharacterized protein n=1 Tax=Ziziphus jujuba var. spinosa TaxID=714518 RepID=A0A978V7H6_ZIZJJ|nr:hypothetical protein FEM48_Zijuj06G0056900 [Ziziphus jujuba var. spinosa]
MSSSNQTLVCVKQVKQEWLEEWDESMPLPGDIIEGISESDMEELFVCVKAKSELSSQLGKMGQHVEIIWVKINVVIAEMSRRVVNVESRGFNKRGIKYDWKMKADTYLPDQRCTVVSSILFTPLQEEHSVEATTARCMAWFSASVSSGTPLVFVNIQTEQIGIRLWFLPGVAELLVELIPKPGEIRFGMDIKRTEEGFICIYSVTKGSAADRAGLGSLHDEACGSGHLLVMSRLEGKSLMPSHVSSGGLIHCCDHTELRDTLTSAIDQMDRIQIHVMAWPNQTRLNNVPQPLGVATLRPPDGCCVPR